MSRPTTDEAAAHEPGGGIRSIAVAAGSIAVITLVARVVGFGRWFAFSHAVGATCVGTTYQSVNAVPNVLFEIAAGGVLAAVAVPLIAGALGRGDRAAADATASALLTWALAVLVPVALVVALAAGPIATALLGAGCAGEVALGRDLLVVFAVQVPLYGVSIVLAGVLQSHRRFVAAAVAPLLSSVVVIATYLLYRALVAHPEAQIADIPSAGTTVLGVGTTLGVAALALPLALPVRRAGIRLRPSLTFPPGSGRRVRSLALAGVLAVAGQQVATLVVIRLANDRGGFGTLNVYTYAQAMALLPYAVLAVPLAVAAFPSLAGAAATDESGRTTVASADVLRRAWLATVVVGLFGAALLVAVAGPVGRFFAMLDAGAAADSSAETLGAMSDAVAAFAPGVLALGVIGLLSRACYVRGHAVAAGGAVALGWVATTALPLAVLDPAGAGGPTTLRVLSIGNSAGLLLGAAVLSLLVVRDWGASALRVPVRPLLAATCGALVAGALGWAVGTRPVALTMVQEVGLGLGVAVGAVAVMSAVALLVDRSLLGRVRGARRAAAVPGAVPGDVTAGGEAP